MCPTIWWLINLYCVAWKVEILGLYKVIIKEPWIILLFPAFLSSNWSVWACVFSIRWTMTDELEGRLGSTLSVFASDSLPLPTLTFDLLRPTDNSTR
jgi:hypothetical protein